LKNITVTRICVIIYDESKGVARKGKERLGKARQVVARQGKAGQKIG
jgi:hypothetical protein